MCKKLILLTLFVALLGLTSVSVAEDLYPPDWAGADNTCVAGWDFDVEPPEPTAYYYIPEMEGAEVGIEALDVDPVEIWVEEEELLRFEGGELGLHMSIPESGGASITAYGQITYTGSEGNLYPGFEYWNGTPWADGEWVGGSMASEMDYYDVEEIDDGVWHATFYVTLEVEFDTVSMFLVLTDEFGGDGSGDLLQVVLDISRHGAEGPPETGPGGPRPFAEGGPVLTATNPRPMNGATEVNAVSVTELVWDDPNATAIPDPNYDVWVNDSNTVVDSNSYTVSLDWGTVYNWRVDVINEPAGDVITGDEWVFTTGGIAELIFPPNEDWWIHTPVDLEWEGDMYAGSSYNLYLGDDPNFADDNVIDGISVPGPNYLVAGLNDLTTYYWMVEEVNTALGGVIGQSETWSFDTWDSTGVPYDDWLGAGHDKDIGGYDCRYPEWTTIEPLVNGEGIWEDEEGNILMEEGYWPWTAEDEDGEEWDNWDTSGPNAVPYPRTGEPCDLPWAMLDLGHDYDLWLMWLWNNNAYTPEGIETYTVHYVDETGATAEDPNQWSWQQLGGEELLPQAPHDEFDWGLDGYEGSAGPSFEGDTARYVLITMLDGLMTNPYAWSLGKVLIELEPRLAAYGPAPVNHAADVPIDTDLEWYAGIQAAETDGHDVYIGTEDEVMDEKKIDITITWKSPNMVPAGESWGWEDEFWAPWSYDMNTAEVDLGGGWYETTIEFWAEANPIGEVITLLYEGAGPGNYIYIDKMVIETDCNPDLAGGQVYAEWSFDTDGVGEDPNAFADPYDFNDGITEEWFNLDWVDGGEWLASYDGQSGVWALDANEFAEMGFSLANYAQVSPPYADTVSSPTYDPGLLDLGTTYVWKVDEVNGVDIWEGTLWDFTTRGCAAVDDFDDYGTGNPITDAWDTPTGGMIYYNAMSVFTHTGDPTYDGTAKMQVQYRWDQMPYNNDYGACYAEYDFGSGTDVNDNGAGVLRLHFMVHDGSGALYAPHSSDQLHLKLTDTSANSHEVTYDGTFYQDNYDWVEWPVALSTFADNGVDLDNVRYMTIRVSTEYDSPPSGVKAMFYVDLIERCVPDCYADRSALAADLSGPDGEPDCVVDEYDLAALTDSWLSEDDLVTPVVVADDDPNELVEYLFASDFTDTSAGEGQYTAETFNGSPDVTDDETLSLNGSSSIEIANDFNALKLFDGNSPYTIAMKFKTADVGHLMSSARPVEAGMEEDDYGDFHNLALFVHGQNVELGDAGVSLDYFYVTAARAMDSPINNQWHTVVAVFDANTAVTYLDGTAGTLNEEMDPMVPGAQNETPLIGENLNTFYPEGELDIAGFTGEIDDVRIYKRALSAEEALYLHTGNTNNVCFELGAVNLYDDSTACSEIVNFKDYAVFLQSWREEALLGN